MNSDSFIEAIKLNVRDAAITDTMEIDSGIDQDTGELSFGQNKGQGLL